MSSRPESDRPDERAPAVLSVGLAHHQSARHQLVEQQAGRGLGDLEGPGEPADGLLPLLLENDERLELAHADVEGEPLTVGHPRDIGDAPHEVGAAGGEIEWL